MKRFHFYDHFEGEERIRKPQSKLLLATYYTLHEYKAGSHTTLQGLSLPIHIHSIYTFKSSHLQNPAKNIWSHSMSQKYASKR